MAVSEEVFLYKLYKDGGVRWNAVFYIIKRVRKLRKAINIYFFYW